MRKKYLRMVLVIVSVSMVFLAQLAVTLDPSLAETTGIADNFFVFKTGSFTWLVNEGLWVVSLIAILAFLPWTLKGGDQRQQKGKEEE